MQFKDNYSILKLLLLIAVLSILVPVAASDNIEPQQKVAWTTGVDQGANQGVEGNTDVSSDFTFSSDFTVATIFVAVCIYAYLFLPFFRRKISFHAPRAPPVAG